MTQPDHEGPDLSSDEGLLAELKTGVGMNGWTSEYFTIQSQGKGMSIPLPDMLAEVLKYIQKIETGPTHETCKCQWQIHPDDTAESPEKQRKKLKDTDPTCPVHTKEGYLLGFFDYLKEILRQGEMASIERRTAHDTEMIHVTDMNGAIISCPPACPAHDEWSMKRLDEYGDDVRRSTFIETAEQKAKELGLPVDRPDGDRS